MIAFVFPGQGSQKKGMGKNLFEIYPKHVEIADNILGYSIKELCLKDPTNKLNHTEYTQPAIFVVNTLTYLHYIETIKLKPNFLAGHSLGEYNALLSAGVFDFETGLKLVQKRGQLMGEITEGGMAAILNLSTTCVEDICKKNSSLSISISNYNTDFQTIISGKKEDLIKIRGVFTAVGGTFLQLNVSGAFHSIYMREAKSKFETYISDFNLKTPQTPVISNLTAKEYKCDDLPYNLVGQIDSAVRWSDTIKYLLNKGVKNFVELGEGMVLTRMIGSIKKDTN